MPVLAIYGGNDFIAHPDDNAQAMQDALAHSCPDSEVVIFPGLDHAMRKNASRTFEELYGCTEPVSQEFVDKVVTWVLQRTGRLCMPAPILLAPRAKKIKP